MAHSRDIALLYCCTCCSQDATGRISIFFADSCGIIWLGGWMVDCPKPNSIWSCSCHSKSTLKVSNVSGLLCSGKAGHAEHTLSNNIPEQNVRSHWSTVVRDGKNVSISLGRVVGKRSSSLSASQTATALGPKMLPRYKSCMKPRQGSMRTRPGLLLALPDSEIRRQRSQKVVISKNHPQT